MYSWLWRRAPGPWWVKSLMTLALICAVVLLCFRAFFPWISPKLPFNQDTLEGSMDDGGPTPTEPASMPPAVVGSPPASPSPS